MSVNRKNKPNERHFFHSAASSVCENDKSSQRFYQCARVNDNFYWRSYPMLPVQWSFAAPRQKSIITGEIIAHTSLQARITLRYSPYITPLPPKKTMQRHNTNLIGLFLLLFLFDFIVLFLQLTLFLWNIFPLLLYFLRGMGRQILHGCCQ